MIDATVDADSIETTVLVMEASTVSWTNKNTTPHAHHSQLHSQLQFLGACSVSTQLLILLRGGIAGSRHSLGGCAAASLHVPSTVAVRLVANQHASVGVGSSWSGGISMWPMADVPCACWEDAVAILQQHICSVVLRVYSCIWYEATGCNSVRG